MSPLISFLLSYLLSKFWLTQFVLFYFCSIPIHELGHAVAAWSGSHLAIPIGMVVPAAAFTTISATQSFTFGVFYLSLCALGVLRCIKHTQLFPLAVLLGLGALFIKFSFLETAAARQQFAVYGGLMGEIFISTLLILSFNHRFLVRMRWDFLRFIALFVGTSVFFHAWEIWSKSVKNLYYLPSGSMLNGAQDHGGDINRLISDFGMQPLHLAQKNLHWVYICFGIIALHYVWSISKTRA